MSDDTPPSVREAIEAAFAQSESSSTEEVPTSQNATPAEAAPETSEPDDWDESVGLDRETWKLTPAQARERAKQLAKEAREAAERAKQYEPLEQILGPRRDALRAVYGSEWQAVQQLFNLSDWASRDPAGFLRYYADARGIDPRSIWADRFGGNADAAQASSSGTALDPSSIEQMLERKVSQKLAEYQTLQKLQEFDANEQFEFRHDPQVRAIMAAVLSTGAAKDLPSAYSIAVQAHEPTRAKLAERQRAEQAKREADEAARKAKEQAAATATVRGAPGRTNGAASPVDPTNLRALIESAYDSAIGRV